ncbi:MAG: tRNA-intron endonuclease, archaea type [Thermoproteota archaeon]|nr:tRNA-intron endonuclease, archaea type [Thermoproteota archaeon]
MVYLSTNAIESVLKDKTVIIPTQENADQLLSGGYGVACENESGIVLTSYEALYLQCEYRISVMDHDNGEILDAHTLLERLRVSDSEAWTKYLIYRDLRSRGYVVREGVGWGINFRVYERGAYGEHAAKYIIQAIVEGAPVPVEKLEETLRLARNNKKEVIVAVMDRRGEIVYYSLDQLNLHRG